MQQKRDLATFFDPDLYLPVNGKKYRIAAPSKTKADELRLMVITDSATIEQEREEFEELLGEALLDQMKADGLTDPEITHCGRTALLHFGATPQIGVAHWHLGQLGTELDLAGLLAEGDQIVGT